MSNEHGIQGPGESEQAPTPEKLNIQLGNFYGEVFPKFEIINGDDTVALEDIGQIIQQRMPQIMANVQEQQRQEPLLISTHNGFLKKSETSEAFRKLLALCFFGSLGSQRGFPIVGRPTKDTPLDVLFACAPAIGTGIFQKDTAMHIEREVYNMRKRWLQALYTYQVVEYTGKYPDGMPIAATQHLAIMKNVEDEELTNLREGFQQHYGQPLIPPTE